MVGRLDPHKSWCRVPSVLKNLRTLREAAGLSREKLAQRCDLSSVTIENAEKGLGVRVETARRIAEALGVTVDDLMAEPTRASA